MTAEEVVSPEAVGPIFSTPIIEHHGLKYRIEMRNNQGIWQQRHIWYPAAETYVSEETAEGWIRSIGGPTADMKEQKR